jgi:hypothetical protein
MDGASLVGQVRRKLHALISDESRGWGDASNALRRIASRESIPVSYLWRILYRWRELKDVRSSVLLKVSLAHGAMCERQLRKYRDEREETQAAGWITEALVSAAESLAGQDDQEN